MSSAPRRLGRRRGVVVAAAAAVVAAAAAVVWFQPQKLLIDERVDEALPGAGLASPVERPAAGDPAASAAVAAAPVRLAAGAFRSLAHPTSGTAVIVRLADGRRVLRLEGLRTDNGPDLRVYLSAARSEDPPSMLDDEFVDLGRLKGNIGDQNYDLPPDVDPSRFRSAVVWCRRFAVGFGVAPLLP